ncbi:hypothetical protein AvCA_43280 [Azotobacter vinelandii CA]|uniref:Uncharacterized protein n=2 Tax=Azotobacter vinelandii TaxID=354 RepID=C1DFQ3_AZOVD|nr:hypothetical protein Avin_43280 [Azotobacter vinelandii DJ]AGK15996.1 hypothetical protein AvCA_43280 [Azotobacter vinelandii CA]AGK21924.1 hypothetical protein AvCA6_43280 [Azotobacter vinelandii CA6]
MDSSSNHRSSATSICNFSWPGRGEKQQCDFQNFEDGNRSVERITGKAAGSNVKSPVHMQ